MRAIAKGGVRLISAALIVLLFAACDEGQPAPAEGPPSNPTTAPAGPASTDGPAVDQALFAQLGQRDFITANENELLSAGTNQRGANSRGSIGVEDDGVIAQLCEAPGQQGRDRTLPRSPLPKEPEPNA